MKTSRVSLNHSPSAAKVVAAVASTSNVWKKEISNKNNVLGPEDQDGRRSKPMGLFKDNCNRSLSTTHKTTKIFDLAPKGNPPGPFPTYTRGAEITKGRQGSNEIITQTTIPSIISVESIRFILIYKREPLAASPRMERDSNPRYFYQYFGFQDRLFQSLRNSSSSCFAHPIYPCAGRYGLIYVIRYAYLRLSADSFACWLAKLFR
ncbi:hypothetical protein M9H77_23668 [Catharanthus roseus]|uniref:Uncharacterized protein n=1 Tax=Catharanthus roseus TaxID=4058 RepID=A0ACC0ATY8_CATRO|nr:hypothetical protein M9H77_23668 [Catharanthus roseus]